MKKVIICDVSRYCGDSLVGDKCEFWRNGKCVFPTDYGCSCQRYENGDFLSKE
jgi:hypothetical protein